MNKVKTGNVGVINCSDDSRLYRVTHVDGSLLHLKSIDGSLEFKTCLQWHFWILLDEF